MVPTKQVVLFGFLTFVIVSVSVIIQTDAGILDETKLNIIEGDIVADKRLLTIARKSTNNRVQKRDVLKTRLRLWKDGLVPYVISNDISKKLRKVIRRAFRRFTSKTCIRFIPKQPEHKDYIHFIEGVGCYSSVGRTKGRQVISLGPTCQRRVKAVHEIMHALGFFHEHSRPDRDNYIRILYWNIAEGQEQNFIHYSHDRVDSLMEPYDYKSIMHYDNKAFSKNSQDTIQVKDKPEIRLGKEKQLSRIDIRQIKKLYKCERKKAQFLVSGREAHCRDIIPGCISYTEESDSCETMYNEFMSIYCRKSCGFCGLG